MCVISIPLIYQLTLLFPVPDLVFGKPATPKVRASVSVDWEDSDSSVDSIHSSPCSSTGDPDWPSSPGYEVLTTL